MLDDSGRASLEAVYRDSGADLWRAILAFSGGRRDVADEVVSEAFAQTANRINHIHDLRPWLYRAAFRIAAGELKRRSTAPGPLPDDPDGRASNADSEVEVMELVRVLTTAQRRAFVLRELLGYPASDAAELLGTSEVSVRVHLHAARKRLRLDLEEASR